jgi:hypothetical protein
VEDGSVVAVQRSCNVVVINGDEAWTVYLHIDPNASLRSGQTVTPRTPLGTLMRQTGKNLPCRQQSDTPHVHLALAIPSGNSATYVSWLGRSFCGHNLVKVGNSNRTILLDGLTTSTQETFTVPGCWTG